MKIEKMTASFGTLNGRTLELGPGLNIIHAPNEGGKSTWCAFLRAMLYGINTRERDTKTTIAEKNRWQCWSGAPLEGELVVEHQGKTIVLRRSPKGATPFGNFSATDGLSGAPLPYTGSDVGQALLGVGREVYERTAFVGQGVMGVTGHGELEKRIASLVSSGEETVSYSKTQRQLKDWQNRRKHNQSGIIPRLEQSCQEIANKLQRQESARVRIKNTQEEIVHCQREVTQLQQEQDVHALLAEVEEYLRYRRALQAVQQARVAEMQCATALQEERPNPPHAIFGEMSEDEAVEQGRRDAQQVEEYQRPLEKPSPLLAVFGATCLLGAVGLGLRVHWLAGVALGVVGGVLGVLAVRQRGRWKCQRAEHDQKSRAILAQYDVVQGADIRQCADDYARQKREERERRFQLEMQCKESVIRREEAEKWLTQLPQREAPQGDIATIQRPVRSEAETQRALVQAQGKLARLQSDESHALGEINALGDPGALQSALGEMAEEIAQRRAEHSALQLALAGLDSANQALQSRFSPALNQESGRIFAGLTGGKYEKITLNRDFEATVGNDGNVVPHRSDFYSTGTVEQLYLAVRLAVCDMVFDKSQRPPLVLDDGLANFDDGRMALALDCLVKLGEQQQILLFTCHQREGAYLKNNPHVTLVSLQSNG